MTQGIDLIFNGSKIPARGNRFSIDVNNIEYLQVGFYRDSRSGIFYLSQKDGKIYIQYAQWDDPNLLLEGNFPATSAEAVTHDELLWEMKVDKKFIHSILEKTACQSNAEAQRV